MWLVPNMTCLGSEAGAGYLLKVPGHCILLALILQLHCCVQFHLLGFSFYSLYSSWLQVNTELQFVIHIGELTQYLVACKLPQHDASCHFKWDFFFCQRGPAWNKLSFITLRNLLCLFFPALYLASLCKAGTHFAGKWTAEGCEILGVLKHKIDLPWCLYANVYLHVYICACVLELVYFHLLINMQT